MCCLVGPSPRKPRQFQRRFSRPLTASPNPVRCAILGAVESVDEELERRFEEAYDDQGVDRSLIRANLRLTPRERLENLEAFLRDLSQVRRVTPVK